MTRNTLIDLNNHLFEQLERLNDEELTTDALDREVQRSKAITAVASKIIDNGRLMLNAEEMRQEYGIENEKTTKLLGG